MSLFQFSIEEVLTFFAVLVRYSALFAVLPIVGDKMVPSTVKILLSLCVSLMLFPGLVKNGFVRPDEAYVWASTTGGIISTVGMELLVGLVLGFTSKLVFDSVQIGANFIGSSMGFSMATTFDPHQESHSLVVAELQMAIAMLIFLALDGHHLILRAALESYQVLGIGKAVITQAFEIRLMDLTSQVLRFALMLSAPMVIVMFVINVVFGVFSKTMPQFNILILSLGISAFVGILVLFLTATEFQTAVASIMSRSGDWMNGMLIAMSGK